MQLTQTVREALDGIGIGGSIYAIFEIPPIDHIEFRPNLIYRMCAEERVIHLGCTDHLSRIDIRINNYNHVHRQLSYVASECIGIDTNEEAVHHLKVHGIDNVIVADMTKPGITEIESSHWDWLVIPDVLEHVPNPEQFLRDIDKVYGNNFDKILITVPNVFGSYISARLKSEVINYDHCFWFTPYTLCKVVHTAGFEIDEIFMCSYENGTDAIRSRLNTFKQYPLLLNTIAITAKRT
jgi:hypothetical protein